MNEVRVAVLVLSLIGLGFFFFAGISEVESQEGDSTKGVMLAGFGMVASAVLAAGALSGHGLGVMPRPRPIPPPKGRGEMPVPPPQQPYGQPQPYLPPQPGQAPPGQPQ